jgi:hypothetical protein
MVRKGVGWLVLRLAAEKMTEKHREWLLKG